MFLLGYYNTYASYCFPSRTVLSGHRLLPAAPYAGRRAFTAQFHVSAEVCSLVASFLRRHLDTHPHINHFSDEDLLALYLFFREQTVLNLRHKPMTNESIIPSDSVSHSFGPNPSFFSGKSATVLPEETDSVDNGRGVRFVGVSKQVGSTKVSNRTQKDALRV